MKIKCTIAAVITLFAIIVVTVGIIFSPVLTVLTLGIRDSLQRSGGIGKG